jgi:hypothetical protein
LKARFTIEQGSHQPDRQARTACRAGSDRRNFQRRPEQVLLLNDLPGADFVRKHRLQRRLDPLPRHPFCQHRQRMPKIDHLLKTGTEKIIATHHVFHYFSQVSEGIIVIPRGFSGGENQCASAWKKEVRYFAGTTIYCAAAQDTYCAVTQDNNL